MSGKVVEFGIRITADGKVAVVEAAKVEKALGGVEKSAQGAASAINGIASASNGAGTAAPGLRPAVEQIDKLGMSAKQTAFAMRQVPMQFTDIIVSLQAGQNPMQVALQQGAQLKDSFGGIGPAALALGRYVGGLINPFTIAAAAAVALAVAYKQGSSEATAYTKAIIMSGNAAGVSSDQLASMAAAMSQLSGTQGKAAEVLAALVSTGRVASASLQSAAQAAIDLDTVGGQSIEDTVKHFTALGQAPVAATLKLNEGLNYLTATTYKQIKAAEEMGDKDRAAEIAQEAYASALGERAGKIQTSLGLLERAWNGVWGAGKRAWDAMRDVGRPELLESKLATAQRVLANAQKAYDEAGPGARNINTTDDVRRMRADQLKQALDAASAAYATLAAAQEKQEATAAAQAKNVALNAAKIDLDRFTEGFRTKAEQAAAEITKAKGKILAAAGLNTQSPQDKIAAALGTEEAEKLLAAVRQKYAEKAASASDSGAAKARAALESEYRMRVDLAKRGGEAEIAALSVAHETGAITEEEYQAKITRIREAAITEAIRLTGELYAKTGDADKRKELILQMQALTADWVKTEEDGAGRVAAAHMKWAAESGKSVDAYIQSLEQSASAAEAANAVYGATDEQVQRLEIARLNDALATAEQGKAQLALVDASPEALAAYQAQIDYIRRMIDARTRLAGAANIKRERDQNVDMWRSIEQAAHTTWTSISKDGKNAFTQIGDTLKAAILDVLYQMTVKKWIIDISASISGSSVAGAAFASGGAGGGAGGGFGGIFNAFSAGSIPSLGTAIGNLSTIGPTFSAMLDSGAGFFDSASAAMTGMGSSFAAVTPYLGAGMQLLQGNATGAAFTAGGALAGNLIMPGIGGVVGGALGSLVGGLFGGGGEDPHNNADASGVGLLLSKAGVGTPTGTWGDTTTGFNGQSPFTFTAGQTSGEGRWADSYAMSEAQIQEITKQVAATFTAGASIAKLLGVDQSVIDSASVSSGQFASVEDALSKLSDEIAKTLIPNIADFQASGEALNQTLMRVATNVQAVNVWSGRLGLTLDSIASKNSLASQFGGAAGMDAALQNYYQSFYSDAERQAQLAAEVAAQFAAMNLSMPTSIAGFRALVSGLDLTTAAGQQTFTELIGVSSAFAQVATTAGGLANSVSTAFDALKKSVDAQRTLAQAAADAAQQQVDQVKSVFDVLTSSINGIYNAVGINAASANAFIDNALANAQKSGYLPESGALSDAISSVSASYGQKVYATEFQRQADQLVLAGKLSQLKDITGSQLTIAEQALNAAKTQLTTLDNILSNSQAQIDQLNGINTSVLSVADAVANLATAMNAQAAAQASATIATAQAGATSATAAGQPIYTQSPTAAALAADPAAMAAFAAIAKPEAAAFGADGDAYIAAIRDYTAAVTAQMAIWQAQTGSALVVQARAGGGYTKPGKVLVGERGPELVDFASPGMVYTAQQTAAILSAIPTANNMGFYSPGLDASPASFSPPGPFAGRLDHLQDQLNSRDGDLVRLGELIGQLNAKMAELISISKDSRREQRRTNDALTGAPLLVTTVA